MANFSTAYLITSKHEGGYVNNPKDPGGETYKGIARNYNRHWAGWQIIDNIPAAHKRTNAYFDNPQLEELVHQLYKSNYWDKILGDAITNQSVANVIYDWTVNSGGAIKQIQKILGVVVDGIFGNQTLAAVNNYDPVQLVKEITESRIDYYRKLVANNSSLDIFFSGWYDRAMAFADDIKKA